MFDYDMNQLCSNTISNCVSDIQSQGDEYILSCNFDDLITYFYDKYKLPIVDVCDEYDYIWEEQKGVYGKFLFHKKMYIRSGKDMLKYHGSTWTVSYGYNTWPNIKMDNFNKTEWLEYSRLLTLEEVERITCDDQTKNNYEKSAFDNDISSFKSNVNYLNNNINNFNNLLLSQIRNELTNAVATASRKVEVRNKLKISVMPISDIRNKKIDIKIVEKKQTLKPNAEEPYYYISNEDYNLIIQIINRCMIQYERTPMTFQSLGEEDIRNIIMGAINANFEFDGSSESFSNTGHTDIMIEAKNKAAFIAECKLWKGAKYVADGIGQLLGYATYKDGKLALLVFNKDTKDFNKVICEMESLIKQHSDYIQTINYKDNKWDCLFKSKHSGTVRITFIVANYHFEK